MDSNRKIGSRVAAIVAFALLAVAAGAWQGTTDAVKKKQRAANVNARALATAVQARGITKGKYDSNLSSYAKDLGGMIPMNPCTGTRTGYAITITGEKAVVTASKGKLCGDWKPIVFSLTL